MISAAISMTYSEALGIVYVLAEQNQPDDDFLDDLGDEELEIVANQEDALEAMVNLINLYSDDLDNIPPPLSSVGRASFDAMTIGDDTEDENDIDFSDPFFAVQMGLIIVKAIMKQGAVISELDDETVLAANSAIQVVEYLVTTHGDELARIAGHCSVSHTIN